MKTVGDLRLIRQIGQGANSEVYLGTYSGGPGGDLEEVAIKMLAKTSKKSVMRRIHNEMSVLSKFY